MTPFEAFQMIDMRVGRIVRCEAHEKARKPAYKLWIDLGEPPTGLGVKTSSAQISDVYTREELVGQCVICATNLGSRSIAGFPSEVLTLGVPDEMGRVVLLQPERNAPLGARVF